MKGITLLWALVFAPAVLAQHRHDAGPEHDHAAEPPAAAAYDTAAPFAPATHAALMKEHGGMLNSLLLAERLERQQLDGADAWLWEAQGWYGGDYRKLWLKTEGHYAASAVQQQELQLLFSRAIAPFWDLQLGLRHDDGRFASRNHAVIGLMGLAPYWFELDVAAFVSEHGVASARLEAEYELRLTQKLLLQPRLELNRAFGNDSAAGVDSGLSDSSFGLRLRYEVIREFAPYVGVEWRLGNGSADPTRLVAGLRLWY